MFDTVKLKLDKELFERAKAYAAEKKFPSVDDFIARLIELELNKQAQEDNPEVIERLKGLGYIE